MLILIERFFYLDDIFDNYNINTSDQMKCDIYKDKDAYYIEIDIPGYNKNEIKVEYSENLLTISAEKRSEEHNIENKKYIKRERFHGKITRQFSFTNIDEDHIEAKFENGTLLLTIPMKRIETRKNIFIN